MATTNTRFNRLFKEVKQEIKPFVNISKNIYNFISTKKSVRSLGTTKRLNGKFGYNHQWFKIYLSENLDLCSDRVIKNVIAHELIHTVEGCFNHGWKFVTLKDKLNNCLGYNIEVVSDEKEFNNAIVNKAKFIIKCEKCGHTCYRFKETNVTKNPSLYHCGCGGKLIVEKV